MRRVLGLARVAQDGVGQAVRAVEMLIGQPAERGGPIELVSASCPIRDGDVDGL